MEGAAERPDLPPPRTSNRAWPSMAPPRFGSRRSSGRGYRQRGRPGAGGDLLERYGIPYAWNASERQIMIGALDVAPTYRDDSVQASVGWPLFTMTLQSGNAPVILTGIVRPSESGDRAWCRVLEFAEEFGISIHYNPFTLLERRGG